MGITPVDPDLWGFCGGAGDVLAAGLPASCMINSSNSMPSTAVTERPGLASPAGSGNAPNAEYEHASARLGMRRRVHRTSKSGSATGLGARAVSDALRAGLTGRCGAGAVEGRSALTLCIWVSARAPVVAALVVRSVAGDGQGGRATCRVRRGDG